MRPRVKSHPYYLDPWLILNNSEALKLSCYWEDSLSPQGAVQSPQGQGTWL